MSLVLGEGSVVASGKKYSGVAFGQESSLDGTVLWVGVGVVVFPFVVEA
jgi:hypothetical protein